MGGTLPAWMLARERYEPPRDRDGFVDRSLLSFLSLASRMRRRPTTARPGRFHPGVLLAAVFVAILLLALARGPFFVELWGAAFLALLALQPAGRIARVLRVCLPVSVFTAVILLPSALLGNVLGAARLAAKVSLSVGAVKLLAETTEWTDLSRALRILRVPELFLLVLDLMLRYVALLGDLALRMLYAVRLRSVGRNKGKAATLGGVAGSLFLKSRALAEDVHAAMECRGFTGSYRGGPRPRLRPWDLVPAGLTLVLAAAFALWGV